MSEVHSESFALFSRTIYFHYILLLFYIKHLCMYLKDNLSWQLLVKINNIK